MQYSLNFENQESNATLDDKLDYGPRLAVSKKMEKEKKGIKLSKNNFVFLSELWKMGKNFTLITGFHGDIYSLNWMVFFQSNHEIHFYVNKEEGLKFHVFDPNGILFEKIIPFNPEDNPGFFSFPIANILRRHSNHLLGPFCRTDLLFQDQRETYQIWVVHLFCKYTEKMEF